MRHTVLELSKCFESIWAAIYIGQQGVHHMAAAQLAGTAAGAALELMAALLLRRGRRVATTPSYTGLPVLVVD